MNDIYHSNNISIVVDNNVLIDLFELDCLSLLFRCFEQVTIPKIIFEEETPSEIKMALANYIYTLSYITTTIGHEVYGLLVNDKDFRRLSMHDRFAIAIAKEQSYYCNSNDRLVRKACDKFEVKVFGILGVLGRAYVNGFIQFSELVTLLDKLVSDKTSCYIEPKMVDDFKNEIVFLKTRTE